MQRCSGAARLGRQVRIRSQIQKKLDQTHVAPPRRYAHGRDWMARAKHGVVPIDVTSGLDEPSRGRTVRRGVAARVALRAAGEVRIADASATAFFVLEPRFAWAWLVRARLFWWHSIPFKFVSRNFRDSPAREREGERARVRERESDGARARARAREESEEASRPRGIDCSWLIVVVGPDWESGSGTIEPGLALRLLPFAQPLPLAGAAAPKAASGRRPT